MRIVVLIKQVPDTTEVRIDPKTGTLIREGVASIINPDDRLALEIALTLKDQSGAQVTALSMGPPQAIDAVTEAYAMGCHRAVLLCDRFFAGADTWATSFTLAKALARLGAEEPLDLVIAGRQAIDGDTAQIGPQVAEQLGWPQVTYVERLEATDGELKARRRLPGGVEEVACPLPALVTVQGAPAQPRWPLVDRLLDGCAPRAPIEVWDAADIGAMAQDTGLRGSRTLVKETFSPKTGRETRWLKGSVEEQAAQLLAGLRSAKLI